jgi:hypothetical protein
MVGEGRGGERRGEEKKKIVPGFSLLITTL